MFYACRPFPPLGPGKAEVTQVRWKWDVIDEHLIGGFRDIFRHLYPKFARWIMMLLLACHLARVTAGAVIIVYEQSISTHLYFPSS